MTQPANHPSPPPRTWRPMAAWTLVSLLGLGIMVFSKLIVFPGLEILLGIETIVGEENVRRFPDGTYIYTNPAAMMKWIAAVAGVGLLIMAGGLAGLWRNLRKHDELHGGGASRD